MAVFENIHLNDDHDNERQLKYCLALIRSEKIGPVSFFDLIEKHGSPEQAYIHLAEKYLKTGKKIFALADAEREIESARKFGAEIISIFSGNYPAILSNIEDAPPVLTVKGRSDILNDYDNSVAVVGARNASALARKFAEKISYELAGKGLKIVSGLARGIDFSAHSGAIASGKDAPTIAVIAGGINNIYPKENEKLYSAIAENGLIISENGFDQSPKADSFPRRNRIISGLSVVTVLVEAAIRSGSLITARFAAEQGREVACVPGFPLDPRSGGTNMLIKNGAHLIENTDDIINILNRLPLEFKQKANISKATLNIEPQILPQAESKITVGNSLLDRLSTSPITIDELVKTTGMNIAELNSMIIEHEIEGKIIRFAGNKIAKAV